MTEMEQLRLALLARGKQAPMTTKGPPYQPQAVYQQAPQEGGGGGDLLGGLGSVLGKFLKNVPGVEETEGSHGLMGSLLGVEFDPWLQKKIRKGAPIAGSVAGNMFLPGFGGGIGSAAGTGAANILLGK